MRCCRAVRAAERGKHVLINPSVAAGAEPAVSLSLTFAGSMTKATAIEATAKQVGTAGCITGMRQLPMSVTIRVDRFCLLVTDQSCAAVSVEGQPVC